MFMIILSLAFFAAGIMVWIIGGRIDRNAVRQPDKARKKQLRRMAEKLGMAARIIFVLAGVFFIFGFILLQGSQLQ